MAKKPTPAQVGAALGRFRTKLKHAFGAVERHEKRLRAEKKRTEKKPHPVTMIGIAAPNEKSKV